MYSQVFLVIPPQLCLNRVIYNVDTSNKGLMNCKLILNSLLGTYGWLFKSRLAVIKYLGLTVIGTIRMLVQKFRAHAFIT